MAYRNAADIAQMRETGMRMISRFLRDEDGATAVEYGLIASLISLATIVALNNVGGKLKGTFNDVANNLTS
jgi:pilus assembly protein Flp/PilA